MEETILLEAIFCTALSIDVSCKKPKSTFTCCSQFCCNLGRIDRISHMCLGAIGKQEKYVWKVLSHSIFLLEHLVYGKIQCTINPSDRSHVIDLHHGVTEWKEVVVLVELKFK